MGVWGSTKVRVGSPDPQKPPPLPPPSLLYLPLDMYS